MCELENEPHWVSAPQDSCFPLVFLSHSQAVLKIVLVCVCVCVCVCIYVCMCACVFLIAVSFQLESSPSFPSVESIHTYVVEDVLITGCPNIWGKTSKVTVNTQ